jgi:hypothetical protein
MATTKKSTKRASAKKTAPEVEPEQAARNRANAANRVAGKADTTRNHDANPDVSTDSSVRHAEPQTGHRASEGHGGYPSGEYDVTRPAGDDVKTKGATALGRHLEQAPEAKDAKKRAEKYAQLSPDDFDLAVEALPVGTVIEHEGPNRWRVHVLGQNRWGHGATHSEAVENFITGVSQTTAQVEADRALAALPAKQQQEIAERDRKAAEAVGGTPPDTFQRIENAKAQAADLTAEAPAPNASTDGPEKASARDAAGRDVPGTEGEQAK